MLTPYRRLLARPGALAFTLAGLLSRFPTSMFNLAVILLIEGTYGSWEMSGRVAAIGVLAWAAQSVPTARWVDRVGQRKAMWPLTAITVLGAAIVLATALSRGPEPILWLGVVLGSMSGPLGSLTRARWSHMLRSNDDDVHTAFSLEGAMDEILFILGPTMVTVLATTVHPAAGLIVAVAGMVIGMTFLLAQTSTEPPARGTAGTSGLGLKVPAAVAAVAVLTIGVGVTFGAVDITTVAFAEEAGHPALGGLVLGVLSGGSFMGGLIYGARRWRTPLWARVVAVAVLFATGFALLGQMPSLGAYAAIGFFAGATVAPLLASADTVVQRVVSQEQLTEGMAWVRIGMGAGVALGAWVAGRGIDASGHTAGMTVTAWAAASVAVLALATAWWIRRDTLPARPVPIEEETPPEEYVDGPPVPPGV
ncbi:MFS transporter [Demequina zhanjiangensis]|uniref:MFS transporter n=1 Tax=Demequina zhanjiangensis TaxID=3051659 RepID=A0ABT8G0R1_9MICO|nr:MFS transporter [Demequina sp. SYSU T00b26]MDN4472294.1 MFS transporter [Demequina sp. SYSU T00b26]